MKISFECCWEELKDGKITDLINDIDNGNEKARAVANFGRLIKSCPSDPEAKAFFTSAYNEWRESKMGKVNDKKI